VAVERIADIEDEALTDVGNPLRLDKSKYRDQHNKGNPPEAQRRNQILPVQADHLVNKGPRDQRRAHVQDGKQDRQQQ